MYNGIGLETARGSGTNGYVQRNLSTIRKQSDRVDYKSEEELKKLEAQFNRKPNRDILEHDRKRQVEVKCMEMQDLMEEQGFTEDEIDTKVTQFRKLLLEKAAVSDTVTVLTDDFGRPVATETHQIALATEEKNARWREAFGIEARDDEKKAFGEEMEKRWEKEENVVPTVKDVRKKEKKKKHRREQSEEKDASDKKKHRREQAVEKDDRKKHRKEPSEERDDRKKNRREPSEERDDRKKNRKEPSEERDDRKKNRREPSEERDDRKKNRREPSEERDDRRKHRKEPLEERDDRKKNRREQSEERDDSKKKNRREVSEERDDKKKHRKRRSRSRSPQSPPKKDRHRRSRSPRSPKHRRHEESPKRAGRRQSSSPDVRSRKKR